MKLKTEKKDLKEVKFWIDKLPGTKLKDDEWSSKDNVDPWVLMHCYLRATAGLRTSKKKKCSLFINVNKVKGQADILAEATLAKWVVSEFEKI
eukprot:Nk52_evm1s2018 gene=Nk52_evmTU1s2018